MNTMRWYLRGCPVCGGDLHDDVQDRDWTTCFLCARSFPANAIRANRPERQPAWPSLWSQSKYPELLRPGAVASHTMQGWDDGYARPGESTGDGPSSAVTVGMNR
jgi:hypothetical protein